ncbi:MAG: glycosyltransferase family 39 protein, partial [Anaerolineae bacterium]|nr:glycosyltransferase family 39 protein [Anaerolineae bacterium]
MSVTTTEAKPATTETGQVPEKRQLRPRRTLNRLALALVGVTLAALGQLAFHQDFLWDGLALYAVAIVLFTRAVASHPYPNYSFSLANPQLSNLATLHRGWRRNVGGWLMLLAIGFSVMGYQFFDNEDALPQAWWMYLTSLVLFVSGGILLTPGTALLGELKRLVPNRYVGLGLLFILALALFMRYYNFTGQPFGIWFDEAEAGLEARRILAEPNYRPLFYAAINVTGQLLATYALALRWLGNNIHAIRSVSALFGVAGVIAAYLFGRELRGPRFGLALSFLMAVARWPVNFSRIAMTGIDTPFFEFLSLFFLVRLFKYGRLRDALWAGLTLGLGLVFYTAFRLFILALLIFAIIAVVRWWPQISGLLTHQGWRRYAMAAAIILAAGWLVIMPVIRFALNNPDAFWYRTRQISILTKRDEANLGRALWQSTHQHLLMFNFSGDKNGRHNLPGEPMLDPLMGLLFVLGFGLALVRPGYPANTFFLILFFTALIGGVFSVDFEAPQALRSIAVIPAVIYFCGLTLIALGREAETALQPLPRRWLVVPVALVAGYILIFNAYTYFVRQANDFASWNAFSAPETLTGRKMAELGPGYIYFLSPFLANHPTIEFLAPDIEEQ